MQINSVNNQNNFGVKFSPRFKSELRNLAVEVFSKDGNKEYGYKYTDKVRDIFERRVQKLRDMMPDAELDIANSWEYATTYIKPYRGNYYTHTTDLPHPYQKYVLKRAGMPDKVLDDYMYNPPMKYPMEVQYLIKYLEKVEKEEQTPVMKAAIDRMKKLLP